jgi:hypothetical protein
MHGRGQHVEDDILDVTGLFCGLVFVEELADMALIVRRILGGQDGRLCSESVLGILRHL